MEGLEISPKSNLWEPFLAKAGSRLRSQVMGVGGLFHCVFFVAVDKVAVSFQLPLRRRGKCGDPALPSLFVLQVAPDATHPTFAATRDRRGYQSARALLDDTFNRMAVRDGGFIKDFQATELDSRTFELFISEVLYEAGACFSVVGEQPDFEPTIRGVSFSVECVTVNPTKSGASPEPYQPMNPRDMDMEDLRHRVLNDLPTRFGGALHAKRNKRFTDKRLAYWELEHTRDKPFVFATQTFHEHGALAFSSAAFATYLYGAQHWGKRDGEGKLVIEHTRPEDHLKANGVAIETGFFDYEGVEHISAVLWANTGTIPKFLRMALQGPYPDPEIVCYRVGSAGDPDPNASAPATFAYQVGDPDWQETWGEGVVLFHNPNALHPLPHNLIETVVNAYIDDEGRYVEIVPPGLHPFMSLTMVGATDEEKIAAYVNAGLMAQAIEATNSHTAATDAPEWWAGFPAGETLRSYRSESID